MKNIFQPGDKKEFKRVVQPQDVAVFEAGLVHPVYATFALARDAEWACRMFVLEMKEEGEEGIGTFLTINHRSPALIGQEVVFEAEIKSIHKNEVICMFRACVGDRLIAEGETGQKVLKTEKLDSIFAAIGN
ncbi:MAG: thioesterase family protein [Bacteroidia bacterium]